MFPILKYVDFSVQFWQQNKNSGLFSPDSGLAIYSSTQVGAQEGKIVNMLDLAFNFKSGNIFSLGTLPIF